jgi:hypothetical protein
MDLTAHKQLIGSFLSSIGALTQQQVDIVLKAQQQGDTRLFGEIAIELNYFDDYAIRRYVDYVELMRKANCES